MSWLYRQIFLRAFRAVRRQFQHSTTPRRTTPQRQPALSSLEQFENREAPNTFFDPLGNAALNGLFDLRSILGNISSHVGEFNPAPSVSLASAVLNKDKPDQPGIWAELPHDEKPTATSVVTSTFSGGLVVGIRGGGLNDALPPGTGDGGLHYPIQNYFSPPPTGNMVPQPAVEAGGATVGTNAVLSLPFSSSSVANLSGFDAGFSGGIPVASSLMGKATVEIANELSPTPQIQMSASASGQTAIALTGQPIAAVEVTTNGTITASTPSTDNSAVARSPTPISTGVPVIDNLLSPPVSASSTSTGTITRYTLPNANSSPTEIINGPGNDLWFVEQVSMVGSRMGRLTTTGLFTEYGIPGIPEDLTVGPDGNVWFASYGTTNYIGSVAPSDGVVKSTSIDTTVDGIITPDSLTAGADGRIWFSGFNSSAIGKIWAMAPSSSTITAYALPHIDPMNKTLATDLTLGLDGNIWFSASGMNGPQIGKITPSGAMTFYNIPSPTRVPNDITVGPDGNIWFTARTPSGSQGYVGRITHNGTGISLYALPRSSTNATQITAGPDGNVWFSCSSAQPGEVGFVTPEGNIALIDIPTPFPNASLTGIATGSDGNIWFSNVNHNSIDRLEVKSLPPDYASGDCQGFSANPVRYRDGTVKLSFNDLSSDGFGSPWGHTREWTNSRG